MVSPVPGITFDFVRITPGQYLPYLLEVLQDLIGDDGVPNVILGCSQSFLFPFGNDFLVKDLFMPARFVGQAVHEKRHGHLPNHDGLCLAVGTRYLETPHTVIVDARFESPVPQEVAEVDINAGILVRLLPFQIGCGWLNDTSSRGDLGSITLGSMYLSCTGHDGRTELGSRVGR